MSALWTLDALSTAMRAERAGALPAEVSGLSIDSRTLTKGDAFFAVQGENRDGHDFVEAALKAGAGLAVVAQGDRARFGNAPLLSVPDVLEGLRDLARVGACTNKGKSHRRNRLGREDRHQRRFAARAFGRQRNPFFRCILQQSLGRAAIARTMSGRREIRGF